MLPILISYKVIHHTRWVSAVEHHTAHCTPNMQEKILESISLGAIYHEILVKTSSRSQVFEKLLWKPSEDASQKLSSQNNVM